MIETLVQSTFQTPRGRAAIFALRPDTSDWNTVNSCGFGNDEYHLPHGISGWALDVGAHIGACTIPLLIDNPELHVVAIEALPENVEILNENLRLNGLTERCVVLAGAAGDGSQQTIFYGDMSSDFGRQHEFIGHTDGTGRTVNVSGISLADGLAAANGNDFAWAKIDCEQCEYRFFATPLVHQIAYITGEHHAGFSRIEERLGATHDVTMTGGTPSFGHFEAVRR